MRRAVVMIPPMTKSPADNTLTSPIGDLTERQGA
jgi:hypothetical protein